MKGCFFFPSSLPLGSRHFITINTRIDQVQYVLPQISDQCRLLGLVQTECFVLQSNSKQLSNAILTSSLFSMNLNIYPLKAALIIIWPLGVRGTHKIFFFFFPISSCPIPVALNTSMVTTLLRKDSALLLVTPQWVTLRSQSLYYHLLTVLPTSVKSRNHLEWTCSRCHWW